MRGEAANGGRISALPPESREVLRAIVRAWLEGTPAGRRVIEVAETQAAAEETVLGLIDKGLAVIEKRGGAYRLRPTAAGMGVAYGV